MSELSKKFEDVLTPFAVILTLLFFTLSYLRIYFGVDLSDEAFYVAQISELLQIKSKDGLILFTRHIYFFITTITFIFSFLFWKTKSANSIALFISCIPLIFIYLSIPNLTPHSLASHGFGICGYLGLVLFNKRTQLCNILALLFCLLAITAFASTVYPNLQNTTALQIIERWGKALIATQASLPKIWALPVLLVIYIALPINRAFKNFLLLGSLLLLFGAFSRNNSQLPSPSHNFLAIGTLLSFGYIVYSKLRGQLIDKSVVLWGLSCFLLSLLGITFGNDDLYSSAVTAIFGFQVFIFLFTKYKNTKLAMPPLILCLLLFSYWSFTSSNHEDSFENLTAKVVNGPYKGLLTTNAKRDYVTQIQYELSVLSKTNTSVLFYDNFPAGYLMTTMTPKTPHLFLRLHPYSSTLRESQARFFDVAENLPDIVYDFKLVFYTSDNILPLNLDNENLFDDPMKDLFFKRADYRLIGSTEFYRVFERQK